MRYIPEPYQLKGTRFLLEKQSFGLLFDPGLGKTATVLHALQILSWAFSDFKALVIAPRLVCLDTWPSEIEKWDRFNDLDYLQLRDEKEIDFSRQEKVWLIDPEFSILTKLFFQLDCYLKNHPWPFHVLVVDESSKFKNPSSKRFKVLKKYLKFFPRRYILTGTFAPNGLLDVFSQQYIMDVGETFGQYITHYRKKYFELDNPKYFTYKIRPGAEKVIQKQIAPWVMRLNAEEHLRLPELVHNEIKISLPEGIKEIYRKIEKEFFAELDDEKSLLANNATSKYLICRQIANGSYYDPEYPTKKVAIRLHGAKTEKLRDLIEELHGKPLLVAYSFKSDLEQICKDHKKNYPSIGGHAGERQARDYLDQWNRRELPVLLAQCSSISHGLNMQAGGNDLCFYSLTDNLEDYEQLIRRIYRKGIKGQVRVHYLLSRGTVDLAVYRRIKNKERTERALLEALAEYRNEQKPMSGLYTL